MTGIPEVVPMPLPRTGFTSGTGWEALTPIFQPGVNLVWMNRRLSPAVGQFGAAVVAAHPQFAWRGYCTGDGASENDVASQLPQALRALPGFAEWTADLALQVEAFQLLFEPGVVGIRLHALNRAMCPRFHVDRVPVRLVTSYFGAGTEWLEENDVDRSFLGRPLKGKADPLADPRCIRRVPTGAVALMKGEAWDGNEGHGLVHRSPPASPESPRWVLTLDWLEA